MVYMRRTFQNSAIFNFLNFEKNGFNYFFFLNLFWETELYASYRISCADCLQRKIDFSRDVLELCSTEI